MISKFELEKDKGMPNLQLVHVNKDEDISKPEIPYGRITFEKDDVNGRGSASIIVGGSDFLFLSNRKNTDGDFYPEEACLSIKNYGNFGIGTKYPSKNVRLDINGIMKLKIESTPPIVNEPGMIAIADGKSTGWDPKGTNVGKPYPVFFNGESWISFI